MSSPYSTNISILNMLGSGLQVNNSVSPALTAPKYWGILSNSAANGGNATQVLGFNRDKGIHPGDTWTFSTSFTLAAVSRYSG